MYNVLLDISLIYFLDISGYFWIFLDISGYFWILEPVECIMYSPIFLLVIFCQPAKESYNWLSLLSSSIPTLP